MEQFFTFVLTQEEFDLLYSAIEQVADIALDRSKAPFDEEDIEHTKLSTLENELLWQKAQNGLRRPGKH